MAHPRLSAQGAQRLLIEEDYVYLDVRSEPEFALGHPEGAYNIPLKFAVAEAMIDNPDFVTVVRAVFAPAQKLVVGCRSGNRSQTAAALLLQAGYACVVEQRAGYDGVRDAFGRVREIGWQAAGLACACEPAPGRDYASLKKCAR